MPPFEPGNQAAKGFGRPRRIDRELTRLREAAAHVDRLIESAALEQQLLGVEEPLPPELMKASASLRADIGRIEAAVALVEAITGNDWSAPRRRGRKQRGTLGRDPFEQRCLVAGAMLDRLLPDDGTRQ